MENECWIIYHTNLLSLDSSVPVIQCNLIGNSIFAKNAGTLFALILTSTYLVKNPPKYIFIISRLISFLESSNVILSSMRHESYSIQAAFINSQFLNIMCPENYSLKVAWSNSQVSNVVCSLEIIALRWLLLINNHVSGFIVSFFPYFSLPDVLCDPTNLIWRKGTPFEAMTGRTAPSSDGLLVEVFWGFPGKCQEICTQPPGSFHYHPYH